jgi:hypothetical protein
MISFAIDTGDPSVLSPSVILITIGGKLSGKCVINFSTVSFANQNASVIGVCASDFGSNHIGYFPDASEINLSGLSAISDKGIISLLAKFHSNEYPTHDAEPYQITDIKK